jgi:transcription elongation factor Elf1
MTRVVDGPCPRCNADKSKIFQPDAVNHPTYFVCSVCGYDESLSDKFPSHIE